MLPYAVEMKGIYKYFGKNCVIDNMNFKVKKGTIHALLGENGAGKTTLMNILYGLYNCEKGEIFIDGKKQHIKRPANAIKFGIGMVHQHFMLIDKLTVTENIILGAEIKNKFGLLDIKKVKQKIENISKKYGLYVDANEKVENISVSMQQRIEILKTLYRGAEILILDEPTAVLTPHEILEFINIIKNLAKDGKSIIIITHKLKEIKQSADYCTIIRKGKFIDCVDVKNISESELASKMVGREINMNFIKRSNISKEVIFSVENLTIKDKRNVTKINNLNLEIKKGEIFGIAGVDGNGQKEFVEAITSLINVKSGKIKINNKEIQNTTPKNVIENGIAVIHEDRHKRGLILDFSVSLNSILESYNKNEFSSRGFLNFKEINSHTKDLIKKFDIRPENCEDIIIKNLSGGNQQKLIIARELFSNPYLLIAVQPTRGLDIGAIEFVHRFLIEERDKGKSILLISLELDEILNLSDRIGVIYEGSIVKIIENNNKVDENLISILMAGGEKLE